MDAYKIIKQNKDVYNKIADLFSTTRENVWSDLLHLVKYTKKGYRVLDLGCGNGRLYRLFKDLSIFYTGIDQSEKLIKIATVKNPSAVFKAGEMTKLDLRDKSFDIIYCIASFQHLPDKKTRVSALKEMKRILVEGGYIIMTNWNLHSRTASARHEQFQANDFMIPWKACNGAILGQRYYHGFSKQEIVDLCTDSGLKIEKQYYFKKGKISDIKNGANLISIIRK
jgi:ubiquinone/menaquinone biosynthesis C-methylase UbiE